MNKAFSIEEYENDYWKDIDYPTALVKRVYEIRKKPLVDLTESDLRIAVIQNVGLELVVPLVLETLKKDILIEADYYPGDLLLALLELDKSLKVYKENKAALKKMIEDNIHYVESSCDINDEIKEKIISKFNSM